MRITGGVLGGRRIKVPEGKIRPAMDRMRESVFAILGDLSGASFLDIFSGSGIVALEAASRGASYIEAIEMDILKRKTLLENVKISPIHINCHFISAELYIKKAKRTFDYIFCDPPFPYKFRCELLESISRSPLVKSNTLILIHRPREEHMILPPNLELEDSREYGRSIVDFLKFI